MSYTPAIGVIIAAAGRGSRCHGDVPKQWRLLGGVTLVERSWRSFLPAVLECAGQGRHVSFIVIVVDPEHRARAEELLETGSMPTAVVLGGMSRTESVRHGLAALPQEVDLVCVHDAARPFWPQSKWDDLIMAALQSDGAILATPMADTLKRTDGRTCETVDRLGFWAAQTPQVFWVGSLRKAHAMAEREARPGTDDAELVERSGGRIAIVTSTATNLKITTPEDWGLAEQMVRREQGSHGLRVGFGYDAHRLGGEGSLILGGVKLSDTGGLIGHSDGDVLLHAVCDALLGAAALGDIGSHFPPGDSEFAGIDSRVLLRRTRGILHGGGYAPHQVDAVVLAEAPRLAPYVESMRKAIADDLGIEKAMVSVKATTTEKMGFVGRGEGIAVQAVATVVRVDGRALGECR